MTKSAQEIVKRMQKNERKEIKAISSRLAKTKYWDLKIEQLSNISNNFYAYFINKADPQNVHEFGITPFEIKENKVKIFSTPNQEDDRVEELTFPNKEKAEEFLLMNKKQIDESVNNIFSPLQQLLNWEEQIKFLDEAYQYMNDNKQNSIITKNIFDSILNKFGLK